MPKDKDGLSKGVKIHYGRLRLMTGKVKMKSTTTNRTLAQIERERQRHAYEVSGMLYFHFQYH